MQATEYKKINERISGTEDTIENIDTTIKKKVQKHTTNSKHLVNTEHNEKIKPKDNRYNREQTSPN
jgi:hypothetical protein